IAEADRFEGIGGFAFEVELVEELETALLRGLTGESVEAGEVDELIDDRHLRVEAAFLGHVADRAAVAGGDGSAVDEDAPGIGGEDAEDDTHGRGLAGAVRTDESGHPAVADVEAEVVQHLLVAEAAVDVLQGDHVSTLCGGRREGISRKDEIETRCARECSASGCSLDSHLPPIAATAKSPDIPCCPGP